MQIKNNLFFILLNFFSILLLNINVNAEEFNISAKEVTIDKTNNIVVGIGEVEAKDSSGKTIKAEVPLAEMFGYATDLRSMSQGRASFSMEFSKYSEAPASVTAKVLEGENK